MSLFTKLGNYDSDEDLRYRQILAEEEAEEEEYLKTKSFDRLDKKEKNNKDTYRDTVKKINKDIKNKSNDEIVEDIIEDKSSVDYNDYIDDYNNFNTITEYDDVDDIIEEDDSVVVNNTSNSFDRELIVSIISNLYKYFIYIMCVCAALLVIYFLFSAKFVSLFLYILSLGIAFMFGYIMMFLVNTMFFKD